VRRQNRNVPATCRMRGSIAVRICPN
jgi:hypothetical protein